MGNAVSLIILTAVVLIVVVVVAIFLLRSTPTTISNTATVNPGLLYQPCAFNPTNTTPNALGSTGLCGSGFICEINDVCVADIGTLCTSLNDCSSQASTCSGRCSNQPTGGLNQLCPCDNGTTCVPQTNGFNVCKGTTGTTCATSSDCVGQCINGFCSGGLPEGSACLSQICEPGLYCDPFGFCQPTGVITGEQNAFCIINGQPSCNPGLRCVSNLCTSTFGTLGSNCLTEFCNDPLKCTQIPQPGTGETTNLEVCTFVDDNVCLTTCPPNFACTSVGSIKKCLGSTGQACISNSNCSSGNCTSLAGLLQWAGITGATWNNVATPPSTTFFKMLLGNGVINQQSNVYMLGFTGLWLYNGTWVRLFQQVVIISGIPCIILDFSVEIDNSGNEFLYLLVFNNVSLTTLVVDQNLVPITNFGTSNGTLIIDGSPVRITSIGFNNFGDIYCTDPSGNVYKNATPLGNFGSKIRVYNASVETNNDFAVINSSGVEAVGEIGQGTGNVIFPQFTEPPLGGLTYNNVANYDMYITYIFNPGTTGSTGSTGSTGTTGSFIVSGSGSNVIMIASPDGVNYQIIVNTGNIQTPYPGYVNANTLVATNAVDTYLYTPNICN
jgi:hypothetical protein